MYVQMLQVGEVTKRLRNTAVQLIGVQIPENDKYSAISSDDDGMLTMCAVRHQHPHRHSPPQSQYTSREVPRHIT